MHLENVPSLMPDIASLFQCFCSPHDLHDYAAPAPGLQIYWGMWTLM